MLSSTQIKELKIIIDNTKKRFPKRPVYSSKVHKMVGELTKYLTIKQISKDLGLSESFIRKIKKRDNVDINSKNKVKNEKEVFTLEDPPLQFIELPKAKSVSQPFVKLISPKGVIIEVWE